MMNRMICCVLTGLILAAALPSKVSAQNGEDIARGLLRALIASQLEKANRRNRNLPDPFRTPLNPQPGKLTPEMQKLRPVAASFSQESATLAALLNTDARRNYVVRNHVAHAVELQAEATALNRQAAAELNHLAVLNGFRSLNSDWTALSHQLQNCEGVGPQARKVVGRLDKLDEQYCSILGIKPTFKNARLTQEAYSLDSHLNDLVDDVRYHSRRRDANQQVLHKLGRLHQQAGFFARLTSNGASYEDVARQYRDLYSDWTVVQPELRRFQDHLMIRNARRIQDSHQEIHELLGMPMPVDANILITLATDAQTELVNVSRAITLHELMTLPDAPAIPAALAEASATMQALRTAIDQNQPPQKIGEFWVRADEAWQMLAYYLGPLNNRQAEASIASVAQDLDSIQRTLGIQVQFNRNDMYRSAASLEEMADNLETLVQKWHSRPGNNQAALKNRVHQLVDACHALELAILRRQAPNVCRQQCDGIIGQWQQIRPALAQCTTPEALAINDMIATFTPELIRLRTMLGD